MSLSSLLGLIFVLSAVARAAPVVPDAAFLRGWSAYEAGRYQDARALWEPLAQSGHADAQTQMGVIFDYGRGVPVDPARASQWYRAAAIQGHQVAQYNLAQMFSAGRGVARDQGQAYSWFRRAAEQGLASAQFAVALRYANGDGVARDPEAAILWFSRAGRGNLNQEPDGQVRTSVPAIRDLAPQSLLADELSDNTRIRADHSPQNASYAGADRIYSGTAWPLANGYVVTNNHVVSAVQQVTLVTSSGEKIRASIVMRNNVDDIALLEVDDISRLPPALPLSEGVARLGASVFTIGYPHIDIMGTSSKLSNGVVSSVSGVNGDPANYQISVPIHPGNSGGPLLNMRGEVVGIVTAILGRTDPTTGETQALPNVGFALKINAVKALLRQLPHRDIRLQELPVYPGDLEELADRTKTSVLLVLTNR